LAISFFVLADCINEKKSTNCKISFHATNQCYSCITAGKYAEETVNKYFAKEPAFEKCLSKESVTKTL
jgi:hypothetical protein